MGNEMNQVTQDHQTIEAFGYRCRVGKRADNLPTVKQAFVIAGIAAGMTQKEIARARGVSPATIKSTAESVYFWLHAQRATDAVAKAMRLTWIAPLLLALTVSAISPDVQMQRTRSGGGRQTVSITKLSRRQDEMDLGGLAA
ncbi:LuxR C-terminal-related transcriptional regulator [Salinicola aestuarinus]|uniref:LuxR C-terminal-related transcriptional regulator n=1 Tax=Salinicola aestuarinus TaxID=1949082 RepID=UPI0013006754|nr:helix-turn-helix transcriptional regulator [Salinicola aestuarinus]